jgi:penicillin amidase
MKRTRLLTVVALFVLGFAVNAVPLTMTVSSLQEESGSGFLILGNPGDQEIFAPTLRHNVTVYRDNWGVPHIYSRETSDAYYAMGYVMAQDRLFEMDLFRRATAGRLAELFGGLMFADDVVMRTLGIYKIANDTWNGLYPDITIPPDVRKNLEQFSNGVNAFIANIREGAPGHPDLVPLEYKALYVQGIPYSWSLPYNWTPPDSVAIAGMMGLMLTDSSEAEIIRGAFSTMVDPVFAGQGLPGMTDFLMPTGWINMTTIMPPDCDCSGYEGLGEIQGVTDSLKELLGFSGLTGSNNWVISENMSATGVALLANDPHLDLQFPGINWQVHVKTDETNTIGCCIPGGPVIYTGHNDYFAFGVTNLMTDVLDLYYYVSNATHYWYMDHWEPFTVTYETILNVTTPVTIPVISTRHGPMVATPLPPPFDKMAFRWCGREAGYGEIVGFSDMMLAKNLTEWRQALSHMSVIIQNFVYADKEGNIAWSPSGALPVRDPSGGLMGVPTFGVVPSNGSAGQNEWLGWIPRATSPSPVPGYPANVSLPYCENPDQGFIATSNNQPIDPSYPGYPWPVWIGPAYTYAPGYRAERITELIQSLAPLTIDEMKAIQGDSLSIPARNFMPYILGTMAGDTNATIQQALAILAAWNFTELRGLVAPLIFEVWYDMYERNTFADEFGPFGLYPFPNMIIPLWNMTQTAAWNPYAITLFDDKNTPSAGPGQPGWEIMPDIINRSLHDALDWIASQLGSNMSNWQYGNLHVVHFNHPMGDFLPYFNVPQTPAGCDGGAYTVDPGGHYHKLIVTQTYLFVDSGASYRGIYECKDDWDTSLILVPPGESGKVTGIVLAPVFDPHCSDTFLMWLNNQYTPCLFNDTLIQTVYENKITFYGIQLRGDINDDGIVDITDLVIVALAFGSQPVDDPDTPWDETKNWNPIADINGDGIVDIVDLVIIGVTFGERLPGDC